MSLLQHKKSISSAFKGIFLCIVFFIISFTNSRVYGNDIISKADSLYYNKDYSEALSKFQEAINQDKYFKENFNINFKIAFCLYQNGEYNKARKIFLRIKTSEPYLIPEYIDYFLFLSAIKLNDNRFVYGLGLNYLKNHSEHFLADSIISYLADFEFMQGNYHEAYSRYSDLVRRKSSQRKRDYFSSQIAYCKYYLDGKEIGLEWMYQHMKKYPSSTYALNMALELDSIDDLPDKHFFTSVDVFLKHKRFNHLKGKLEKFIQRSEDVESKEKARYYLIQIYYGLRQYKSALYGYENFLDNLQNKSLESRVYIGIARCYLRLGQKETSAEKYIDYAKRFPRRRLAVEAVWKAAWIYEGLGKIDDALVLYDMILKHWPRSSYKHESKFRIGFSYYRLGKISKSMEIFKSISEKHSPGFHYNRGIFWLAKIYEKLERREDAVKIYLELGRKLFSSYYSVKSYLMYKQYFDNLLQVNQRLASYNDSLDQYKYTLASLMHKFKTVFHLLELIDKDFALIELVNKKYIPQTLEEWVAFADIYKRIQAYNSAFRIYDYIDNEYFDDIDYLEKPFILKEKYPLYFNNIVENYSDYYNVDKNLIMAVMRQESAYDKDAHSWANAYGLMQIIPPTAIEIKNDLNLDYSLPQDLFNAKLNIHMGTYYLRKLLDQFEQQPEYALAAYNAGPHRVIRWKKMRLSEQMDFFIENIEFSQTRDYVRRVMRNYWIYSIMDEVY